MFDGTSKQGKEYRELQQLFEKGRAKMGNDYDYYNLIEGNLLEVE